MPQRARTAPARTRKTDAPGSDRRAPASALATLVADYIARVRSAACEHLAFYASQPSLAHALEVVAGWRGPDGGYEPHQRGLPRASKLAAAKRVRALAVGDATTFTEIHRRVSQSLTGIARVGPRAIYDVSLRLGAVLGLPPEQVYMHTATRRAARFLGLSADEPALPVSAFPSEFRRLYAWEIENLLCRYCGELRVWRDRDQRAA